MSLLYFEFTSRTLKPCPFCGRDALMKVYHHVPTGYDYTPTCTDKSCAGRLTKRWTDINLAVKAWNKRAETSEQEPKTGHWVSGICDNCGYDWGKDAPIASVPNFCPNCGCRMFELQESEIHCNYTDAEIAKSFIEDVEAVKDLLPQESDRKCHTCKHYLSGEHDGSCGSYICKEYSNWESEVQE